MRSGACKPYLSHFSFVTNTKRATAVLDLINCDLWGPAPILSTSGYAYYNVFIDDYSRFSLFYLLKLIFDFYAIF